MIKSIYIPDGINEIAKETAKKLGMSQSRFIQYCITRTLEQLSVLSSNIKERKD